MKLRLAVAATIMIAVLVLVPALTYAHRLHDVTLIINDRSSIYVSGYIEFDVAEGSINLNGIDVGPGTVLKLVLGNFTQKASIWIGSDGWISISVDKGLLYANGSLVISRDEIDISGIKAELGSVNSTLTIGVTSHDNGYTWLEVDGTTVVNDWNSSDSVEVSGLVPTAGKSLDIYFSVSAAYVYCDGEAESVLVNGENIPVITSGGLLVLLTIGIIIVAVAAIREK